MKTPVVVVRTYEISYLPDNTSLYELVKINFYIHLRDNLREAENMIKSIDDNFKINKEKYKIEATKYKQVKRQNDYIYNKYKDYLNSRDYYSKRVLLCKSGLSTLKKDLFVVEDYKSITKGIGSNCLTYNFTTEFSVEDKRDYELWLLLPVEDIEVDLPYYPPM